MLIRVALVGLLVAGAAHAQAVGQLTDMMVTGEQSLGALKVVEGQVNASPSTDVTVWVNGVSGQCDPAGRFRILVPNEPNTMVQAFQAKYNVTITLPVGEGKRAMRFNQQNNGGVQIRDLLNKNGGKQLELPFPNAVTQGGGDGGIRDLLNKPKAGATEVTQGGGDGGIRDLLNKPKSNPSADPGVTSGGGDGGIRDLLNKPKAPSSSEVTQGGGDGGIRDLLNKPTASPSADPGVTSGGGDGGIRDLLNKPAGK